MSFLSFTLITFLQKISCLRPLVFRVPLKLVCILSQPQSLHHLHLSWPTPQPLLLKKLSGMLDLVTLLHQFCLEHCLLVTLTLSFPLINCLNCVFIAHWLNLINFLFLSSSHASHPLELLHLDLCDPAPCPATSAARYVLLIIDDFSRCTWLYFLSTKDQALPSFINFKNELKGKLIPLSNTFNLIMEENFWPSNLIFSRKVSLISSHVPILLNKMGGQREKFGT